MGAILAAGVPLIVATLFAGAIAATRWRQIAATHARDWSASFALIAAGWLVRLLTSVADPAATVPGAASSLCWLAAAMLLVHGLRQRARRADRAMYLAAIWIAIAFAIALVLDLYPDERTLAAASVPLLAATGLTLAAIAVGPRRGRSKRVEWAATGLLAGSATGNLALVAVVLAPPADPWLVPAGMPLAAGLIYVGVGLAAMLLLNADLAIALERLARIDPRTGVWNRRGFDEAAPHLIDRTRGRPGLLAAVAIADIDTFKGINDRHGHNVGDAVLVGFARTLGGAVERGDLLARLGGEEFALLAIGCDGDALLSRVEQVRNKVGLPDEDRAGLPPVTASFGVAEVCTRTWSLRDALERADHALYRAKREGRNRSVLAPASTTRN